MTNRMVSSSNTHPSKSPIYHKMNSTKTLFLLIALLFGFNAAQAQTQQECIDADFRALVTLYLSAEGWNWNTTWDLNQPVSTWHGVTLNQDGCVTGLSLSNNNLNGEIPDALCSLTNLRTINFVGNQLTGVIPECIGDLSRLSLLDLSVNELSGSIPMTIGKLNNLRTLNLFQNELSGFLPYTIGELTNLFTLNLQANQLEGAIPEDFGNLKSLFILSLDNNELIGSIPESIGNLTRLFYIDLGYNNLSGSIPASISNMENLFNLELSNNQLSGEIPAGIMGLSKLQSLWLSNNQLSGSIPEDLTKLKNLEWLVLNNNQLSGSIPETILELEKVSLLYLGNNQFSGTLPLAIADLVNLREVTLNDNNFEDCFPTVYESLCGIRYNFSGNTGLPNNGDFDAFCESGAGTCVEKSEESSCGLQFNLNGEEEACYAVRNLTINITAGTSPFKIELDGPLRGALTTTVKTLPISGAPSGAYSVIITDAEGCMVTKELTIATSCSLNGEIASGSRNKTTVKSLPLEDFLPANYRSIAVNKNYPNPFLYGTTLPFTLSHASNVNITVTTAAGQRVFKLQEDFEAGSQEVTFNSGIFKEAGIYIYQIQSGETVISGKMIRLQ